MQSPFFPLAVIDQSIQRHLRLGGNVRDEVGVYLIGRFIDEFLNIGASTPPAPSGDEAGESAPTSRAGNYLWYVHSQTPSCQLSPAERRFIQVLRDGIEVSGVTRAELMTAFSASIEGLMPNPCIRMGGSVLAGVLAFRMPLHQTQGIWWLCNQLGVKGGECVSGTDRELLIRKVAIEIATSIKQTVDQANGEASFSIDSSGNGLSMEQAQQVGFTGPWGCILVLGLGAVVIGFGIGAYLLFR
jgi:hypothetical protein